jgi:hypothetical protein
MDAKNAKNGETRRDPTEDQDAAPAEAAATEPSAAPSATPKEREAQGKRRLGMMPEVLPAPSNHSLSGSPRQRTVRTMERLLAAAAATALLASCSSNHGSGASGSGASGAGAGGAGAGGTSSSSGGGYGVVDPLPPPARCEGVAATIQATAVWKDAKDGSGLIVELQLPKPGQTDASYDETRPPSVAGATLVSSTNTAGALTLELAPIGGTLSATVKLSVTCADGLGHLDVALESAGGSTPKAGDPVKVSGVYDSP